MLILYIIPVKFYCRSKFALELCFFLISMNKFTSLLLLLFCMMGVMNAQEQEPEISGFTKAAENKTLPSELTTGYF